MAIKLNGSNTEASPGFTGDDTDTGLQCGTNELSLVTGGSKRATVDSSGNVGINETSPSTFNDAGTGGTNVVLGATGSGRGVLTFAAEQTGGSDEPLGIINFIDSDTTNSPARGARMLGMRGSDANSAWIRFDAANSGAPAEVGRFTPDGAFRYNSGFGSVATAFGCRAWVNFDGKSGSIGSGRANGNISSIDDNGTGQYTVNFTNSFPDNDYAVAQFCRADSGGGMRVAVGRGTTGFANSSIQIEVRNGANNNEDVDVVCLAFFR